jgi:hypothetical protein
MKRAIRTKLLMLIPLLALLAGCSGGGGGGAPPPSPATGTWETSKWGDANVLWGN